MYQSVFCATDDTGSHLNETSTENRGVWFGLVWIRLFRPFRVIAEPWDEGDGKEWAKNGCRPGDLSAAVWDANPGAMPREVPKPLTATSPGGRLKVRLIPGGRQPPGPA